MAKSSWVSLLILPAVLFFSDAVFAQDETTLQQYMKALNPGVTNVAIGVSKPTLTMHLEFKYNSAELTPETINQLNTLSKALLDQALRKYIYIVEGHTCNQGNKQYNLDLSQKRAQEVVDYVVKTTGLSKEQFQAKGYGASKPFASNDNEDGRQKNRRVVIINSLNEFKAGK